MAVNVVIETSVNRTSKAITFDHGYKRGRFVTGLAFGQEVPLLTIPIFIGILLHGICYDFFFVTGMIYTDKKAQPEVRGQAQSLVVMLTQGFGLGIGAQAFGYWMGVCTSADDVVDWSRLWYAPALFALGVMVAFALLFWERSDNSSDDSETNTADA